MLGPRWAIGFLSRRGGAIVARHEVPGTAPTQKSRPVGYGLILEGVRTSNVKTEEIYVFRKRSITSTAARTSSDTPCQATIGVVNMGRAFNEEAPGMLRPIIPYPTGRILWGDSSQALRAWLRSACPSGTKPFRPSKSLALGWRLRG
jgi:hypothetical protein